MHHLFYTSKVYIYLTSTQSKRIFHILTSLITTISFIIYLALSTGQGITTKHATIHERHKHVPDTDTEYIRQVLWLRFVNWALTTPLLFINFTLLSGLPGANLLIAIVAHLIMLATALLGIFSGHGRERWVWLTLTCISYLVVIHHVGFHAQRAAKSKDVQARRLFGSISGSGIAMLALFPM
jgi:bacteriorhodopsin